MHYVSHPKDILGLLEHSMVNGYSKTDHPMVDCVQTKHCLVHTENPLVLNHPYTHEVLSIHLPIDVYHWETVNSLKGLEHEIIIQ